MEKRIKVFKYFTSDKIFNGCELWDLNPRSPIYKNGDLTKLI